MKPETTITPEGKEVTLIHYIQAGRIVCMPNLVHMSSSLQRATPHMRTDNKDGVTCPMCKRAMV